MHIRSILTTMLLLTLLGVPHAAVQAQQNAPARLCLGRSWQPEGVQLKDHTLFRFDGFYYLAAIQGLVEGSKPSEQHFFYARTKDFCTWEELGTILGIGPSGGPDEQQIWAPYVISFGNTWYMFYTGVNRNYAQTTMLATSTNPADPQSWTQRGPVFQPNHAGMLYAGPLAWSDNRDPMVFYDWERHEYMLYYTGRDNAGCPAGQQTCGIIGVATAERLDGPWSDQGAVLRLDGPGIPESAYVVAPGLGGTYYLFYSHSMSGLDPALESLGGQKFVVASSPIGPWSQPERFLPGWASDFFQSSDGWVMSYLRGYRVAVTRLDWDVLSSPPRPHSLFERRAYLPLTIRR